MFLNMVSRRPWSRETGGGGRGARRRGVVEVGWCPTGVATDTAINTALSFDVSILEEPVLMEVGWKKAQS